MNNESFNSGHAIGNPGYTEPLSKPTFIKDNRTLDTFAQNQHGVPSGDMGYGREGAIGTVEREPWNDDHYPRPGVDDFYGMNYPYNRRAILPTPDSLTLEHLTTTDLKMLLHSRGLSTYGNRLVLIRRLTDRFLEELPTEKIWVASRGQSQRRGACCVVWRGLVYQFGGLDTFNKDHNTIFKWAPDSSGFQEVKCKGQLPCARWTSAAVVHEDFMYVLGGYFGFATKAQPTGRLNDLWRFDFKTLWWSQLGPQGVPPCCRSHHNISVIGGRLILFGGLDEREATTGGSSLFESDELDMPQFRTIHLNDVFVLDLATLTWTPLKISGPSPFGGLRAAATIFENKLFTMGWREERGAPILGSEMGVRELTNNTYTFEMWRLKIPPPSPIHEYPADLQWEEVAVRGTPPSPRDSYSQVQLNGSWLIHAGRDVSGDLKNDTYNFNFSNGTWTLMDTKGGENVPDVRYNHKAVALGGNMVVVGGVNKFSVLKDTLLSQRCAAVEKLYLRRPVPPKDETTELGGQNSLTNMMHNSLPDFTEPPLGKTSLLGVMAKVTSKFVGGKNKIVRGGGFGARRGGEEVSAASDVTLVCGGMRVHAHKSVLESQSRKFAQLLKLSAKELALRDVPLAFLKKFPMFLPLLLIIEILYIVVVNVVHVFLQFLPRGSVRVLAVRDVSYPVLLGMLQYMYNCLEELDEVLLLDMFKASVLYDVPALHQDCLRHLQDMMHHSNVGRIVHLAEETKDKDLYAACVNFCAMSHANFTQSSSYITLLKLFPSEARRLAADVSKATQSRSMQARHGGQPINY